jgi:hypothetical protein
MFSTVCGRKFDADRRIIRIVQLLLAPVLWSRIRKEPELLARLPAATPGRLKYLVLKNQNLYCIGSSIWIRLIFFQKKLNNPLFNMKSVIKGSYKANVGAGAGAVAGAGTFWKSEPERKQKVSAPQHWLARSNYVGCKALNCVKSFGDIRYTEVLGIR